jgi:hypothetical protein
MIIRSRIKDYCLTFENDFDFVSNLLKSENAYFVIDKNLYELYQTDLFGGIPECQLTIIESLEVNKTIETAPALFHLEAGSFKILRAS